MSWTRGGNPSPALIFAPTSMTSSTYQQGLWNIKISQIRQNEHSMYQQNGKHLK